MLAQHQRDDLLLGARGHVHDPDGLALAQDGGPVADGGDLDQPMRDEDHGPVAAALAADDLEDALGQVRRQRGGHLVEHQDVRLDGHGAGEVDDPQRCQRDASRQARQIELLEAQLMQPVTEGLERRLGEAQVRPDVEVGDERRFLVDGDEAAAARLAGRMDDPLAAPDGDRAAVGPDGPGQDLDEGALAGAIRTHERVDLARPHGQRRRLERDDRAIGLRDVRRLEQKVGGREGHRSRHGGDSRGMPRCGIPRVISGTGRV